MDKPADPKPQEALAAPSLDKLLDELCTSPDKTYCQRGRTELRAILQQALAAPLEPRCPKCGSIDLSVGIVQNRIRVLCGKCPRADFVTRVDDFAQFFTAQPPSAMTEPGVPWPLNLFCEMHTDTTLADANVNDPCPLCAATAAEPHTLTREQVLEKAWIYSQTYEPRPQTAKEISDMMADFALSLSLPSTRPSGEEK